MTIRNYRIQAAGLILGILGASAALATESGTYLGGSFGQSTIEMDRGDVDEFFAVPANVQIDDSDTAYSVEFGYRFMPYVGVELSYTDFGESVATESGRISTISFLGELTGSVSGFGFALVGTVPVGNFEFNAKVGLLNADTDTRVRVRATGGITFDETNTMSNSSTETLYGLGAGYTIADHFHIRVDWMKSAAEYVVENGDDELEVGVDVQRLSVGFQYRF